MGKVYCKSDFEKLEREYKFERLKQKDQEQSNHEQNAGPTSPKTSIARKVGRALSGLWQIVRNPWLLNLVIDNEEDWRKKVIKKYGLESGLPFIDIQDLFPEFEEVVSPYAFLDGSCQPTDLALLRALARKFKAESYLEIGTWRGESVANVAPLVREAVSLNLPDAQMKAMGLSTDYIGLHRYFSENIPNVKHLLANSLTFDFKSLGKAFDLIFIDGDHHYAAVRSDTEKVLVALKKDEGIMVWHDYARSQGQVRWSVLAAILDALPTQMHKHLYYISNTLSAVYLPILNQGVLPRVLNANEKPKKFFEVKLKIVKM